MPLRGDGRAAGPVITAGGVAGVGYYTSGGSSEARDSSGRGYYTGAAEHGEPPGRWSGRLGESFGLTGQVTDESMVPVFTEFRTADGQPIGSGVRNYKSMDERLEAALALEPSALPERIEQIKADCARGGQSSYRGVDMVFSVPKSVSIEHAAAWRMELEAVRTDRPDAADEWRSYRTAIEAAIGRANEDAMEHMASLTTVRAGKHGNGYAGTWLSAPDLAVAQFAHHTSRLGDPQFHIHNVVLNRARGDDGKVRAIDTKDLVAQRLAFSATADRRLAEELGQLGIRMAMRPDGVGREIVGISEETRELYSLRRIEIRKALEPAVARWEERLGRPLNDLERRQAAQSANLVTRTAKEAGKAAWDTTIDGWEARLNDMGSGLAVVAERMRQDMARGPVLRDGTFSPDAVAALALHNVVVSTGSAHWTRAALELEVEKALPLLGKGRDETRAAVDQVVDHALGMAVQVGGNPGTLPPSDLIAGSFVRPSSGRWASPGTLAAEDAIRQAAVERWGHSLSADDVSGWLDDYKDGTIGDDQRAAVVGIASTSAAITQMVGPAGTGKSFAAGALSELWGERTDGQVHGLAVSKRAAEVLRDDGVLNSSTIAGWRESQARLEAGRPMSHDLANAVGPRDLIAVDESSMPSTADMAYILELARSAGARVVLMGDPRQLGPVEAGGVMGLVADRAETFTLTDVRRFVEEWERSASLGVREGDVAALAEYDRRGRLVEAEDMDSAITAAARAAAAERLAGRSCVVTADTNEAASQIANEVRAHLVAAGMVEADGVQLPRTGGVAGIGDLVMTRQNDHGLGVVNRATWTVVGTGEDGSLSVLGDDGTTVELPAAYVAEHVQHGYASTVHSAQGMTVDVAYTVTDGGTDAAKLYVGMTRGRERNTAFVALRSGDTDHGSPLVEDEPTTARAVLSDSLEAQTVAHAARVQQEIDAATVKSMDTLMSRIEEATDRACRTRMNADLDRLVEAGVLGEQDRARLATDASADHLSRVLRAGEQAGHDPAVLLREAVEARSLGDAESVAKVLAGRVERGHQIDAASPDRGVMPERLPAEWSDYLERVRGQADDRVRELGSEAAEKAPAWAVRELGPVPDDVMERLEWEAKAGTVAGWREATGWDSDERTIGSAPGLSQTEHRAQWWDAWEALGRPEETRAEAALSDGRLLARVAAWEREQTWAPAHGDASLRQAELDADEARREAILARAADDEDAASEWEAEAESRGHVARAMADVVDGRSEWAGNVAVTEDLARRAAAELELRGLAPGAEDDRISADEWLAHQREVDARDEAVREVTDLDVPLVPLMDDSSVVDSYGSVTEDEDTGVSGESLGSDHFPEESGQWASGVEPVDDASEDGAVAGDGAPVEVGARESDEAEQWANQTEPVGNAEPEVAASPDDSLDDTPENAETAGDEVPDASGGKGPGLFAVISTFFSAMRPGQTADWKRPLRDEGVVQATHEERDVEDKAEEHPEPVEDEPQDDAEEPASVDEGHEPEAVQEPQEAPDAVEEEDVPASVEEPAESRSPAHDVAPVEPDEVELDALVAVARDAQEKVADRESEEAAHDAWEAEEAAPLAEGSSGADDVDEAYAASDMLP